MVSTIRIGPEGGPYVKVEENNGALDITTPNDTVDLQSNDLVNAALGGIMNAKGNDITNVNQLDANSVNTDQQIVGGSVRAEKLDEFVQSEDTTSTVDVEFTGLSNGIYLVEFAGVVIRDSGVVDLTVNGVDGGGNGSYTYFDETGTKQTGVDAIELLNNTSFVRPLGTIIVRQRNNRLGVKPMLGAGEMVNLNGFAQAGGADSNVGSLTSIKLSFTGGLTDNDVIRLWRGF